MVIRHAEKPTGQPGAPAGVTSEGAPNEHSLTVRGWQRAGALVALFTHPASRLGLVRPARLICPEYTDGISHRVHETLEPLAARLGIAIDFAGTRDDPMPAALAALASSAPVLLCWDHENIPALGAALLASAAPPANWPDDRFDMIWLLHRMQRVPVRYDFAMLNQDLLVDDAARVAGT